MRDLQSIKVKGIKMNINIGRMQRKKRNYFLFTSVKTRIGSAGIHASELRMKQN